MFERDVAITKLDAEGHPSITYPGRIVFQDADVTVVRCRWALPETVDLGLFVLRKGDILLECYYPHRPFNIFVIYDAVGRLKGWYCNVLERTEIREDAILWWDLAVDLLITPGGHQMVLDEDEFEALSPSPAQRERVRQALQVLQAWFAEGAFPFNLPR